MGSTLGCLVPVVACLAAAALAPSDEDKAKALLLGFASCFAFFGTVWLIPIVKQYLFKANMWGKDINKPEVEGSQVPESLGLVCGTVFLFFVTLFGPFFSTQLAEYNAALTSICMMLFLGFADDVLNLRWATKIILSFLSSLPLLLAYSGATLIIVPKPVRFLLGTEIPLGYFYHFYMSFLAVFCTNSINIYAGINGLEAGQSLIIGLACIVHNLLQLGGPFHDEHFFSLFIMVPFVAVTLGLLVFNWYPSQVFVGDSFTYFAGTVFAVAGILGHFSKTMMLFFIPQILNFALSLPQLFNTKWLPCPRHRLPRPIRKTPTYTVLEGIKTNWNVVNAALWIIGPTHERTLCKILLSFQVVCCAGALLVRYSHNFTNAFYDSNMLYN